MSEPHKPIRKLPRNVAARLLMERLKPITPQEAENLGYAPITQSYRLPSEFDWVVRVLADAKANGARVVVVDCRGDRREKPEVEVWRHTLELREYHVRDYERDCY